MPSWNKLFNNYLNRHLYEYDKSLKEFYIQLGVSRQYLNNIKSNSSPSLDTLNRIIEIFNLKKVERIALIWAYIESNSKTSNLVSSLINLIDVNDLKNSQENKNNSLKSVLDNTLKDQIKTTSPKKFH